MQQPLFCVSYFFLRRKDSAAVQPLLQGAFDLAQAFHQAGVEHAALSVQDAVRDADLADVVQSRSQRDDILLLVCDEVLSGVH